MTFAEKFVALRKAEKLSQEDIAEKLNLSRQAISRWEMGTAMPDANNLLQISNLFNVSIDYLLRDDITEITHNISNINCSTTKKTIKFKPVYFFVIYVIGLILFPSAYIFLFKGELVFISVLKSLFSGGIEALGIINTMIFFTRLYISLLLILALVYFIYKKLQTN